MIYSIKMVYNDGNELDVQIPVAEYAKFFASLNEGKVFWDAEKKQGFWTSIPNIRYMRIFPMGEPDAGKPSETCQEPCIGNGSESVPNQTEQFGDRAETCNA